MMVVRREPAEADRLNKAALIAATGISSRYLIRARQQGLIPTIAARRGLGRGRGTTPLEYPQIAVATINRLNELRQQFKDIGEQRWRLWLEAYPVRIAPDLADTIGSLRATASQVKTLADIETKMLPLLKPAYMPRSEPLRVIFRDLSETDLHELMTINLCLVLGVKLPLFDEPNPHPFQVLKRALGLPKEWQLPPGLFDAFPYMYEQIRNALSRATDEELEGARAACRLMSRFLDNPENSRRGAIVIAGAPLPWRVIRVANLMWPSPVARAATVGLVILGMRLFRSALGNEAAAAFASAASMMSILLPGASGPVGTES